MIGIAYHGTLYAFRREPQLPGLPPEEADFWHTVFAGNFSCTLTGIPRGDYVLELWLCELWNQAPGARLVEVSIDGRVVDPGLDFFAVGGFRKPFRKRYGFRSEGAPVRVSFRIIRGGMSFFRLVVRDSGDEILFADGPADRIRKWKGTFGDKSQVLHAIGNAHIDPVWQWRWQEGCAEVLATLRSALDLLREFPDLCFTCSSAQYFAWVEELDPAMLREVRDRVAEGRFEIVGGWWVQPDCNIPCGEAFARHSLYAQRFFLRALGRTATTGYNVDSFGHAGTLPQILVRSGMTNYVFMRPQPSEKPLPAEQFWWEAPDGSRVLACRLFLYNSSDSCPDRFDLFPVISANYPCRKHRPYFFGVGNHGGGPTRKQIEGLMRLDRDPSLPRIAFSTTQALFEGMRSAGPDGAGAKDYPVVCDDLQHHAPGCYTTHSGLKRGNRRSESLLLIAERFDTIASVVCGRKPATERLELAWRGVLSNQFHDTMGGSAILDACEDALDSYGRVIDDAGSILNAALRAIAARVNTVGQGTPFLLFNPTARARREVVNVDFCAEGRSIADDAGNLLPSQSRTVDGVTSIAFLADLPALGYRVYRLVGQSDAVNRNPFRVNRRKLSVSNGDLSVRIDRKTGAIVEMRLAASPVNFAEGPLALPILLDDGDDAWGHNTVQWTQILRPFKPVKIELLSSGPARATFRIESAAGPSRARLDVSVAAGARHVDLDLLLNAQEPRRMTKLVFHTPFRKGRHTASALFGFIERTAGGTEDPCQAWVDLHDESGGLAVINDSKYGYDVDGSALRLTVARTCPYVGSKDRFHDIGEQLVHLAIVPHTGDWRESNVHELSVALNEPVIVVRDYCHAGELPPVHSFASCQAPNVDWVALKGAEEGGDVILRLVETRGREGEAVLDMPFLARRFSWKLGPCEIASLRVPRERGRPPVLTNLTEME
ncbi:MAG: glycoside hydrolase family 38 C-terminal domain-containing protein [Planctomycetota bacterium]